MAEPDLLESLDQLHDRYDAVLCDIWGVVHDGRAAFPAACSALRRFRAAGGTVLLISNVPKPRDPIPAQLAKLGADASCYDGIVTSGDAIRAELAVRAPGPMWRIGPPEFDASLWAGLDLAIADDLADAAFIGVSGLNDDRTETPESYVPLLQEARARDLELLCANPDIQVRVGDRLVWCAGALAREYAMLGGRVVMAGKPYPPIYALAYAEIARLRGVETPKPRMLAIGDGVPTDLAGAASEGLDCLFVAATGLHGGALLKGGRLDPAKLRSALEDAAAAPRYAMAALA